MIAVKGYKIGLVRRIWFSHRDTSKKCQGVIWKLELQKRRNSVLSWWGEWVLASRHSREAIRAGKDKKS